MSWVTVRKSDERWSNNDHRGSRFWDPLTLRVWNTSSISVAGVRWILDGMSVASRVIDEPRFGLWNFTVDTLSKCGWLLTHGTRSESTVWSITCCTCLRAAGLRLSIRDTVLQRAARGVLACSLLDHDEPVRTMSGPTPLLRSSGAMSRLAWKMMSSNCVLGSL
jgi:hypothetical protein